MTVIQFILLFVFSNEAWKEEHKRCASSCYRWRKTSTSHVNTQLGWRPLDFRHWPERPSCPRHLTKTSRQHQPGDMMLLVVFQLLGNVTSASLTGGAGLRSGPGFQVSHTFLSFGGLDNAYRFRVLRRAIKLLKVRHICYEMAVQAIAHTNHVRSGCSMAHSNPLFDAQAAM